MRPVALPAQRSERTPAPRRERKATNVRRPLAPFVGRASELLAVRTLLTEARLVTVSGPAGVGKTRLAIEVASPLVTEFEGGVWFVDLAERTTADELLHAIANAAKVMAQADGDLVTFLARALREPTLLVLDNFEQMNERATRELHQLLTQAEAVTALVTSRRALSVEGEHVFPLAPLALTTDEGGARSPAAELFVKRAVAAGATRGDLPATDVDAIVRAVDGVPLAIELVASRARGATTRELLAGLTSEGERGEPLRRNIERSFALLSDEQIALLSRCAVFSGPFTAQAAAVVAERAEPAITAALVTLRDHSLLVHDGAGARSLFRMYVSLRDVARAKLAASPASATVRELGARAILREAAAARERFAEAGREVDREELARLLPDLQAIANGDGDHTALAVWCLEPVATRELTTPELCGLLTRGVLAAERRDDDEARRLLARLLLARGIAVAILGDAAQAVRDLDRAREVATVAGAPDTAAEARVHLAVRYRQQGDLAAARSAAEAARRDAVSAKARRVEGEALAVHGLIVADLDDGEVARASNLAGAAIFKELEAPWWEALCLANLAQLGQAARDFDDADARFDEALRRFRAAGDRLYEGRYWGARGTAMHERGDIAAAGECYARGLALLQGHRAVVVEAVLEAALGSVDAESGRPNEAEARGARAEALLAGVTAPLASATVEAFRGQIALLLSRRASERGDEASHQAILAKVRAARSSALRVAERSMDGRAALRLLDRLLVRHDDRALVVGPAARWFATEPAGRVDLTRRGALHRVLDYLVDERLRSPGRANPWSVLLHHGWPNEKVLVEAGATRVRVAVATLRKLGLADVLVTRDDGYLLAENVLVRRDL